MSRDQKNPRTVVSEVVQEIAQSAAENAKYIREVATQITDDALDKALDKMEKTKIAKEATSEIIDGALSETTEIISRREKEKVAQEEAARVIANSLERLIIRPRSLTPVAASDELNQDQEPLTTTSDRSDKSEDKDLGRLTHSSQYYTGSSTDEVTPKARGALFVPASPTPTTRVGAESERASDEERFYAALSEGLELRLKAISEKNSSSESTSSPAQEAGSQESAEMVSVGLGRAEMVESRKSGESPEQEGGGAGVAIEDSRRSKEGSDTKTNTEDRERLSTGEMSFFQSSTWKAENVAAAAISAPDQRRKGFLRRLFESCFPIRQRTTLAALEEATPVAPNGAAAATEEESQRSRRGSELGPEDVEIAGTAERNTGPEATTAESSVLGIPGRSPSPTRSRSSSLGSKEGSQRQRL